MGMNSDKKTLIVDIDGTVLKHHGDGFKGQFDNPLTVLPGVVAKFKQWDIKSYNIIFLTGRRESHREETEKQLKDLGLIYDQLVMGVGPGPRYLINDRTPDGEDYAHAINLDRNEGFSGLDV